MADTPRGVVTIRCGAGPEAVAAGAFQVRVEPRGRGGRESAAGPAPVGSYDDLDTALTIAAVGYGAAEAGWAPADSWPLANAGGDD
jgi:hypothetical protein